MLFMLFFVGGIYIYDRLRSEKNISKLVLLCVIGIPFTLPAEPTILHFFINVLWFGSLLFLIRYYWRWNPLSFMFGVFCLEALPSLMKHLSQIQDPSYRNHILLAIFCIGVFIILFEYSFISNDNE